MNKYLTIILTVFLLLSCAGTKHEKEYLGKSTSPDYKQKLDFLSIKANLHARFENFDQQVLVSIKIGGVDSCSMNLIGPFGVNLGRLYSDKERFIFFSTMENTAMEGSPTAENLEKAMRLPMSFYDFIRLLRCETPGHPADFSLTEYEDDPDLLLFKNNNNDSFIEYALYSPEESSMVQYQRKLSDGTLILNVHFREFENVDGFRMPKIYSFTFPEIGGSVKLDVSGMEINNFDNEPFSFELPVGIKRKRL